MKWKKPKGLRDIHNTSSEVAVMNDKAKPSTEAGRLIKHAHLISGLSEALQRLLDMVEV